MCNNHFERFGLPVGFAIDDGLLTERYRTLVDAVRAEFARGEDDELVRALAQIDEAYRTLLDPLARAEYLFELYEAQGLSAQKGCDEPPGASLIEEMERQETLVAATNRSDPHAALSEFMTRLAERGAALDKTLHQLFADPSPHNLRAARAVVRQLQMLARCRREAEGRQAETLGVGTACRVAVAQVDWQVGSDAGLPGNEDCRAMIRGQPSINIAPKAGRGNASH
ncbi:molecular chaperone Hsc20 [Caldichromatium japonicum]|uniref:Molecular chaperone Hsc20 n=1 Tax=Caldichromatium japonicum TaxID=2699430 RepID=A0A6G7VDX1_9GAMM|nr:iron-sulfur cluster co-chaperone HscB C-terminal domain-containing protein [Caldichromatium japonicum]QIK38048.1 molecular chaperone Hsc20 [Caldichromatium japonicum]